MAETKKKPTVKETQVVLMSGGKEFILSPNDRLPESFLESKLKENQRYIPVHIYRDIMRQIGEFGIPKFGKGEKIITGKNRSGSESIAFKMDVEIEWNKPGTKEPIMLRGSGYSAMSGGVMLSDAIHGNFKTLEAKALRDALKYSYLIFEFPEVDVDEPTEDKDTIINNIVDEVTKDVPVDKKKEIEEAFDIAKKEYFATLLEDDNAKAEKGEILKIATALKEKFGEEYKKTILEIITPTLNESQ